MIFVPLDINGSYYVHRFIEDVGKRVSTAVGPFSFAGL